MELKRRNSVRINASYLLRYLKRTRQLSTKEFCGILDISKSQFSRLQSGKSNLTLHNILTLEDSFNLKISKLYKGMISENSTSELFNIPKVYSENPFTKEVSIFYLGVLRRQLGEKLFIDFMNYEGLPPEYFANTQNHINIRLSLRIFEELIVKRKLCCDNLKFYTQYFCDTFKLSKGSNIDFFNLINSATKFEENNKYVIEEFNNKNLVFSFFPKDHVDRKIFLGPILGNMAIEWIKSLSETMVNGKAKIIESISYGGKRCVISVSWPTI